MIVISYTTIRNYTIDNNCNEAVTVAFDNWYTVMLNADFANLADLRQYFNSVDFVGNDRYVFNILGNHYRLIALIHFNIRTVYVLFIGTHKEYDKVDAPNVMFKK